MPTAANLPDLIISLSHDKVIMDLSSLPEEGRSHWKTSFSVEGLFLEEKIAHALDEVLLQNPVLVDHFPCVEVVVLDRPHVTMPKQFMYQDQAILIASKYLRLRSGDTFSADLSGNNTALCYTVPTSTLYMLKEYYNNISVTHISSLVWQYLSKSTDNTESSICFFGLIHNTLLVISQEKGKLCFSKTFNLTDDADLMYYAVSCSRMLKSQQHSFFTIENEEMQFEFPMDSLIKIDNNISLPSLHKLLSQYKACEL